MTQFEEAKEVWPWIHEDSGRKIHENLWYAFGDSGWIGAHDCERRMSAVLQTVRDDECKVEDIGWLPEHLGSYGTTVLTGRQFVDQLKTLSSDPEDLFIYGKWSEA